MSGTQANPKEAPADYISPMLAQTGGLLEGRADDWLLEPKLDGLRCVAVRNGSSVALFSRNHLSFNLRFPRLVKAVGALPVGNFVLDGEIVGTINGKPDFGALQQGGAEAVQYWVFDLPWLLGRDLRPLPLEERKHLLEKAVPESDQVRVVRPLQGEPEALLAQACDQGWEGLVAKRIGSPYLDVRSGHWLKLKCGCRQELVVGGFTAPKGTRTGFGALLLGYWQDGGLAYAGKVGTGFSDALLTQMLRSLLLLEQPASPFAERVVERSARWVRPELVAEVGFTNWTADGRLRHPRFLGLRADKPAADVRKEPCGPGPLVARSQRRR